MTSIASLFAADPDRAERFSLAADGLYLDYSKTTLTHRDLDHLLGQIKAQRVTSWRDRMFCGEAINTTEDRPVLHTALRDPDGMALVVNGQDFRSHTRTTLQQMVDFAEALKNGSRLSSSGQRYTHLVNIGIGGSDLGPKLAIAALAPNHAMPTVRFLSNVDGTAFHDCAADLDPRTTLFVMASKSFRTPETLMNAQTARTWLAAQGVPEPGRDFVAITAAPHRARDFGIDSRLIFPLDDGVGGRYSLWGSIGLPVIVAAGAKQFKTMLAGARSMDRHFRTAAPRHNLPMLLALIGLWHSRTCGHPSRAVIPYESRLALLPAYLQQLEMESNGKSVARTGAPLEDPTVPVVWGTSGTDGQHSYFQMLHQGTRIVPCEFMIGAHSACGALDAHHQVLLANCLAQAEALMTGRDFDATAAILAQSQDETPSTAMIQHRTFAGNRPTTTLVYDRLTPFVLGQILALYEHRTFVEGIIMGINSFDQWGVELGKSVADSLLPAIDSPQQAPSGTSPSTRAVLHYITALRNPPDPDSSQ